MVGVILSVVGWLGVGKSLEHAVRSRESAANKKKQMYRFFIKNTSPKFIVSIVPTFHGIKPFENFLFHNIKVDRFIAFFSEGKSEKDNNEHRKDQ